MFSIRLILSLAIVSFATPTLEANPENFFILKEKLTLPGQLLEARGEMALAKAQKTTADLAVKKQTERLHFLEKRLERTRSLYLRKATSEVELENAQQEYTQATLTLELLQSTAKERSAEVDIAIGNYEKVRAVHEHYAKNAE